MIIFCNSISLNNFVFILKQFYFEIGVVILPLIIGEKDMGPLTEGNMKGNIKSQTTPTAKRNIKHSEKMHDENAIYSIMSICLILGGVCIGSTAESSYLVLPLLYVVSILISLVGIYLLPKFRSVNINHAKNMRRESLILLFVLFLGPIMAMFVLTILLLPPKKRRHIVQLIKLPKK